MHVILVGRAEAKRVVTEVVDNSWNTVVERSRKGVKGSEESARFGAQGPWQPQELSELKSSAKLQVSVAGWWYEEEV